MTTGDNKTGFNGTNLHRLNCRIGVYFHIATVPMILMMAVEISVWKYPSLVAYAVGTSQKLRKYITGINWRTTK